MKRRKLQFSMRSLCLFTVVAACAAWGVRERALRITAEARGQQARIVTWGEWLVRIVPDSVVIETGQRAGDSTLSMQVEYSVPEGTKASVDLKVLHREPNVPAEWKTVATTRLPRRRGTVAVFAELPYHFAARDQFYVELTRHQRRRTPPQTVATP